MRATMRGLPSHRRMAGAALIAATAGQLLLALPLATVAYAADGAASDSSSSVSCAPGYYYCWSNVQQKSVCTTRKCY